MDRGYMEEAEYLKERTPPGGRAVPLFTKQSLSPTRLNIPGFMATSELNEPQLKLTLLTVQADGQGFFISTKKTGVPKGCSPAEAWFIVMSLDEQLANCWRLQFTKPGWQWEDMIDES